ncbi:MAG: acyltransferase family protein [Atopobiaceae bacterium]|nr:acyltransferase family protein [Atopobiaceae bacterium]
MPSAPAQQRSTAGAPSQAGARVACFDWLRACGCLAIVLLHVFVTLENASDPSQVDTARFVINRVLGIVLGRWAVPGFLMVTGALLLDPAKRVGKERLWRYIQRMLFVLGTFGLFFCLIESVVTHGGLSLAVVGEALHNLVTARSWDHLWYMYALLVVYCCVPGLRALVARLDQRGLGLTILVLAAVVFGGRTALLLAGHDLQLPLNAGAALFYCLMGWYAWKYLRFNATWVALGVTSLAIVFAATRAGYPQICLPEYGLIAPYGVLVFLAFVRFATTPMSQVPAVAALADHSFGIYVIHPLFLHVLTRAAGPIMAIPVLYEALSFAIALGGSYIMVDLLRRIPIFASRI